MQNGINKVKQQWLMQNGIDKVKQLWLTTLNKIVEGHIPAMPPENVLTPADTETETAENFG